jgi:hypothetical protein
MDKARRFLSGVRQWILENKELTMLLADEPFCSMVRECTGLDIHNGIKVNKVIQRVCREFGLNTHPMYNTWIAKLGDAISPKQFTRHTVVSINPIDYWTASWGDTWCSCMNIDKNHKRESSREGLYGDGCCSSGTESYMLDPSTVVVYTVDSEYNGKDFELQDKINRCLFHVGESKFIMGRVYPQGTDGADDVYREWREIFQYVLATCMDVPNYWKTEKDRSLKNMQHESKGTHYEDYIQSYCDVAGWSWLKTTPDAMYSPVKIKIGHRPICPCCGEEHDEQGTIECCDCFEEKEKIGTCERCGANIYRDGWDDDYIETHDGILFCDSSCARGAGYVHCADDYGWYHMDDVFRDGYDDCYYPLDYVEIEAEDGEMFYTHSNAENADYIETDDGWYHINDCYEDAETGELFHNDDSMVTICKDYEWYHFESEDTARAYGFTQDDNGNWVTEDELNGEEAV